MQSLGSLSEKLTLRLQIEKRHQLTPLLVGRSHLESLVIEIRQLL
jgi:hypothetical protein